MNWEQMTGKWDQMKGEAKTRWSKLTNDDLMFVAGQRDKLIGKVQERYGMAMDQARKEVEDWVARLQTRIDDVGRSHRT